MKLRKLVCVSLVHLSALVAFSCFAAEKKGLNELGGLADFTANRRTSPDNVAQPPHVDEGEAK